MKAIFLSIIVAALMVSGCAGGLSSLDPFKSLIPSPTPTPTLGVQPASLTLSLGQQKDVTASESGQSFFTAQSTNVNIASVAPVNGTNNAFSITAVGAGSCDVDVMDENGQVFPVKVTVN